MEILSRTLGARPRLACEVRAEGVVAARAEDSSAMLEAVSRAALDGVTAPRLSAVDTGGEATTVVGGVGAGVAGRAAIVAAVRTVLEAVSLKSRDVTLVVPDAAVRVLLLDFDELPAKVAEALPVVRFRLKKLLPFDADDAAVSFQVMATAKESIQVLAVAMPREVLVDYESLVREAGFEPGAVIPSTLAALAGLDGGEMPRLVVNAGREGVTTAIVKGGVLLLHRTVDLAGDLGAATASGEPAQASETTIAAIAARMAGGSAPAPLSALPAAVGQRAQASEVAQAVSVAAAYFEDTLETAPSVVLAAGTLGAETLTTMLDEASVGPLAVQEIVERQALGSGATVAVPLGWLAGVRGALAN